MSTDTLARLRKLRDSAHRIAVECERPRDDGGVASRHPGASRGPFGACSLNAGSGAARPALGMPKGRNDGQAYSSAAGDLIPRSARQLLNVVPATAATHFDLARQSSTSTNEPMDAGSGAARPALSASEGRHDNAAVDSLQDTLASLRRLTTLRRSSEIASPFTGRGKKLSPIPTRHDAIFPGIEIAPGVRRIDHPPLALPNQPLGFDKPEFAELSSDTLLAIDTETTGLAGGTGTRAFIIGIARWQQHQLHTTQWLLTALSGESAMLDALASAIKPTDILLSYNGKSYDMPLLRTRWRLARQADPTQGLPHLDLLHAVRRRYRGVWENCRLATVERQLLRIVREDDLPGSEAPAAFTRWLREGDAGNLVRVLEHNRQDLVSLMRLAERMGAAADGPHPQVSATSHRG